jgi:hypothetical protein
MNMLHEGATRHPLCLGFGTILETQRAACTWEAASCLAWNRDGLMYFATDVVVDICVSTTIVYAYRMNDDDDDGIMNT